MINIISGSTFESLCNICPQLVYHHCLSLYFTLILQLHITLIKKASTSATAKYRQKRINVNKIKLKNPSILTIPVTLDDELIEDIEGKYHDLEKKEQQELEKKLQEQKSKSNGMASIFIAGSVAAGAAAYSGFLPSL